MFIAIDNNDMNIPQVLDWINRTKNANNNVISPEFAMEILTKTNFYGHIKAVLKSIKENCKTKEDILPYKEFILSCVEGREMSDQAMTDLQELVKLCGCKDEFDEANGKPKCYFKDDCHKVFIVKPDTQDDIDLSMYKKAVFEYDKNNYFASIFIRSMTKLPKICDFSYRNDGKESHRIQLYYADLANVDSLIFGKGDKAIFGVYRHTASIRTGYAIDDYHAENLHGVIDVSMCSVADFSGCDLKNVEELKTENVEELTFDHARNFFKEYKFKNNKIVNIDYFESGKDIKMFFDNVEKVSFYKSNLPEVLDLSGCDEAVLENCKFDDVKEMKFKKDGKLTISGDIPDDFDFSIFDEVTLNCCDLNKIKNLKFKDGAKVFIDESVKYDGTLDVSNCGDVIFTQDGAFSDRHSNFDMSKIKKIKFKNEEQMKKSLIKRDYRKFVFEEYSPGMGIKKIASLFGEKE